MIVKMVTSLPVPAVVGTAIKDATVWTLELVGILNEEADEAVQAADEEMEVAAVEADLPVDEEE